MLSAFLLISVLGCLSVWVALNTGTKTAYRIAEKAEPQDGTIVEKHNGILYFYVTFRLSSGDLIAVKARKRDFQYGLFIVGDNGEFKQGDMELTYWKQIGK
ncbi:MAG TPA: hypothetical protein PKJ47_13655 [Candidatus Limiplasma sp.]|nr:hypothetical protein [Candidatus Limiplasma sp.]